MLTQPLRFTGPETDPAVQEAVARLVRGMSDARLDRKWMRVDVAIHRPIKSATPVERMQRIWNDDHFPSVKPPEGLPSLANGTPCPAGSRWVEVSCISRPSGGMGSYFQFDGLFVSLVVSPDLADILDARIEKAY